MAYVDGCVIPVPVANKATYIAHAEELSELFKAHGALEVVDCWESDVSEGEVTSFPKAVQRKPDEAVVLSWITWPSKEVRDAGWAAIEAAQPFQEMPFDGRRMIFGGFERVAG